MSHGIHLACHPALSPKALVSLCRVWGLVSSRGGNTLELTDGSGAVVRVTADAALLTGISPGTFVIATGELDSRMQPAALQAHSVEKVEPEAVP